MCINISSHVVESSLTGSKRVLGVPCGKCVECTKRRQNDWKLRLIEECNNWNHLFFFTLTYSEVALPHSDIYNLETGEFPSTGRKSDIQGWLKRNRERYFREYGERLDLKYFIALEYAPDGMYVDRQGKARQSTCRPHYHGLLFFDCDPNRIKQWFADWRKDFGFYKLKEIVPTDSCPDWREHRSKVCNYVAKYTAKGEFQSRIDDIEKGLICRPFLLCSKNIGLSYVDRMRDSHLPFKDEMLFTISTMDAVERDFHRDYGKEWKDKIEHIYSLSKVCDGEYRYKMPRYWYDRIYGYPYKQKILKYGKTNLKYAGSRVTLPKRHFCFFELQPSITYIAKEVFVKRFSRENWLSLALQYFVQCKYANRYQQQLQSVANSIQTDDIVHAFDIATGIVNAREDAAKLARYKEQRASLYNFYNKARFKTPELMYAQ